MTMVDGRHLSFPFRIGPDGRTATPRSEADHIRDELVQLILTSPGERPFLPEFGGGARKLIFENTSDSLRGISNARITQAVSRFLGHRATLEKVDVSFEGERVNIDIRYRIAGSEDSRILRFQRAGQ